MNKYKLLGLALFNLGIIDASYAQTKNLNLPANSLATPVFYEEQVALENRLQTHLNESLSRLVGNDRFYNVVIHALLEPADAPPSQIEEDDDSNNGVVYTPLPPSFISSANGDANFKIVSIEADVTLDSRLPAETKSSVQDFIKSYFRIYPAKVRYNEIKPYSNEKAPETSTPSASPSNDGRKSLDQWLLLGGLGIAILAFLLVGNFLKQGLSMIGDGLKMIGDQFPSLGRNSKKVTEVEKVPDPKINVPLPLPPIASLRNSRANLKLLRDFLNQKPTFFIQALKEEDEKNLIYLRPFIAVLSELEKSKLKKFLGKKIDIISASLGQPISKVDAAEWLESFSEKINMAELSGMDESMAMLSSDDLLGFNMLEEVDFKNLAHSLSEESNEEWNVLAALISRPAVKKVIEDVPQEKWIKLFSSQEVSGSEFSKIANGLIQKAKSLRGAAKASSTASPQTERVHSKLMEGLLTHAQGLSLVNEFNFWSNVFKHKPEFEETLKSMYWHIGTVSEIPTFVLQNWLAKLSDSQLAQLAWQSESAGARNVTTAINEAIPQGIRKTILESSLGKLKNRPESDLVTLKASKEIRNMLETLRLEYLKGEFELNSQDNRSDLLLGKIA